MLNKYNMGFNLNLMREKRNLKEYLEYLRKIQKYGTSCLIPKEVHEEFHGKSKVKTKELESMFKSLNRK